MKCPRTCLMFASLAMMLATAATAAPLPRKALDLTPDELMARYAGHTAVWGSKHRAFFAADGTVLGFRGSSHFEGTWAVTGSTICMNVRSTEQKPVQADGDTFTDCWEWQRVGKNYWQRHSSTRKAQVFAGRNDWHSEEHRILKRGDFASAIYRKLSAN